jgi:hypothetical protein
MATLPRPKVTVDHYDRIRALYNNWIAHYHDATDLIWNGYGNLGAPATQQATRSTSGVSAAVQDSSPGTGLKIGTASVNAIVAKINSIKVHAHTVQDDSLNYM